MDIGHIRRCVAYYLRKGLRPVPSRTDMKSPAMETYSEFWGRPLPDEVYEKWSAKNIQLLTGTTDTERSLIVVDCDGEKAIDVWNQMCARHGCDPTWIVRTGGNGRHFYFLTDPSGQSRTSASVKSPANVSVKSQLSRLTATVPTRKIWGEWDSWPPPNGTWKTHSEIRILSGRRLAVAPPSVHVDTGRPYEFIPGSSPVEIPTPARFPDWLGDFPAIGEGHPIPPTTAPLPKVPMSRRDDRDAIINSVPDKVTLASSLGLKVAGRNRDGWVAVHAIGRDDLHPSACLNAKSGVYIDHMTGQRLSYLDLLRLLGGFDDWRAALNFLAKG